MAQTGFTPMPVVTPSTGDVAEALKGTAHLYRRAAATSPQRVDQQRLHHAASSREQRLQQMEDWKKAGNKTFGRDPESTTEKKLAFRAISDDAEVARQQIHIDFRPESQPVKIKVPVPAMFFALEKAQVLAFDPEPIRVPSAGDTPGRVISSPSSPSVPTIVQDVVDPAILATLRKKKERMLNSPSASDHSSRMTKLEEIRLAKLEAHKKLIELDALEQAYATTVKLDGTGTNTSGSSSSAPKVPNFPIFTPVIQPAARGSGPVHESYKSLSSMTGIDLPEKLGPSIQVVPRNASSVSSETLKHELRLQAGTGLVAASVKSQADAHDDEETAFLASFQVQWEEIQARKAVATAKAEKVQTKPSLPMPTAQPLPSESRGRPNNRGARNVGGKTGNGGSPPSSSSSSSSSSTTSSSEAKEDRSKTEGRENKKDKDKRDKEEEKDKDKRDKEEEKDKDKKDKKGKKYPKRAKKRKPSSSSSSSARRGNDKMTLAAWPTAAAFRQWRQHFRLEVVSCSKVSRRKTIAWLSETERKGVQLSDLAESGKKFSRLDDLIAASLTKLAKGEIAREVSTKAEKLYSTDQTLLTGRQLVFIMAQEFAEDLRKTMPHAISDLSKLVCKNAGGLEHWLASFNSIVELNIDLQEDLINFHAFEQLKSIDPLSKDIEAYERLEDDDPAKSYRFLVKAVTRYIRKVRTERQRVELQSLNNTLPTPAHSSLPVQASQSAPTAKPKKGKGKS